MDEFYNKHYIRTREDGCVVDGFSDAFRQPSDTDICINEQGGYQFRLFPDGEENPTLFDWDGMLPLYAYVDGRVVRRTEEEMEADRAAISSVEAVPTEAEDTAAMLVDHEYRLTLLELGLTE